MGNDCGNLGICIALEIVMLFITSTNRQYHGAE